MKYEPAIVQHPLIKCRDDGAVDEFERRLDEGIHEWTNRDKLTTEQVSQQLPAPMGRGQRKECNEPPRHIVEPTFHTGEHIFS